jgi:hypothetical protein
MLHIAGIKTETDSCGKVRYLRIDMNKHGNNELLEDFLDSLAAKNYKKGETISLAEFNEHIEQKLKKHV